MSRNTTKSDTEDKNLKLFELDTECGRKVTAMFDAPRLSSLAAHHHAVEVRALVSHHVASCEARQEQKQLQELQHGVLAVAAAHDVEHVHLRDIQTPQHTAYRVYSCVAVIISEKIFRSL